MAGAMISLPMTNARGGAVPAETAAIARKLRGTSSVAMVRMPRLVVGNFH